MFGKQPWRLRYRAAAGVLLLALALSLTSACAVGKHWYKGNVHCHSLWSDGNCPPDFVADWYKSRGYQFLALTDHNIFQEGGTWAPVVPKKKKGAASQEVYDRYKERFGARVEEKTQEGQKLVRLKTFADLAKQFDEAGKFLMIPAEEITTQGPEGTPYRVHTNAVNIARVIPPPVPDKNQKSPGAWVANTNARLIDEQRQATGLAIHGHLNHPLWSHLTFEDVCAVRGFNQMEINNDDSGNAEMLPQSEKLWDTVLADRIKNGLPLMLALAVDDCHNHLTEAGTPFGAGHGWIVVRARSLTAANVVKAIDAGEFYATRGPDFLDIRQGPKVLALEIKPVQGLTFKTEFIGMKNGGEPGQVLATSSDLIPVYKIQGDELYLRAKVTSSKARKNDKGEVEYYEMAWTQPYEPAKMK